MQKTNQGSITVFLTLLLGILISLVGTSLVVTRNYAARVQILDGMDIGLFSVFSRYDKALLEKYDLFFLNTDLKAGGFSYWNEEFEKYLKQVLGQNYQRLVLSGSGIASYELATDKKGAYVYDQAVEYMKTMGVTAIAEEFWERMNSESEQSETARKVWENAGEENILQAYDQQVEVSENLEKTLAENAADQDERDIFSEDREEQKLIQHKKKMKNPIPVVKKLIGKSLLSVVLPEGSVISGKSVNKNTLFSHRRTDRGTAIERNRKPGLTEDALFREYCTRKFGDYMKPGKNALDYELEYLVGGKESDYMNLKEVAAQLLLIREGLNLSALLSDYRKMTEVRAMAAMIASAFLFPPAAGIIETALILCWSFGESILDLRVLFNGGRVSAWKNSENWQLSLEHLITVANENGKGSKDGLDYEDYLKILLCLKGRSELTCHAIDLMEMGMRSEGHEKFRMDHCVGYLEFWVQVDANRLRSYQVKRGFSYI